MEAEFEPTPHSVGRVRAFIQQAATNPRLVADMTLVASELATNVIRHANTGFTVRITEKRRVVRLEISDGSSIPPAIDDLDDSKRGLRIVEALTAAWGFDATDHGKTIWAEFSTG